MPAGGFFHFPSSIRPSHLQWKVTGGIPYDQ
nr:MAG TPA: hypothetical protein [Caudoviricetes sp.]